MMTVDCLAPMKLKFESLASSRSMVSSHSIMLGKKKVITAFSICISFMMRTLSLANIAFSTEF